MLQGFVVNEAGTSAIGEELLEGMGWSYDGRWWYCYVAVLLFATAASLGVVAATQISWLKR